MCCRGVSYELLIVYEIVSVQTHVLGNVTWTFRFVAQYMAKRKRIAQYITNCILHVESPHIIAEYPTLDITATV